MKTKNYLYGSSGHSKVVLDVVLSNELHIEAIIDDNPKDKKLLKIPIIHSNEFIFDDHCSFIIAIGNNLLRKKITDTHNFHYFNAIHSGASVSEFSDLCHGNVVMPQAVINAGVQIGSHCIINSSSVIEHDCILADYVHISPNASLAGNVSVGEGAHIGIGASIIQGITIGKWVTVGAGAVIIENVPDYAVVVGNPGKIIKYNPK